MVTHYVPFQVAIIYCWCISVFRHKRRMLFDFQKFEQMFQARSRMNLTLDGYWMVNSLFNG